MIDKPVGNIIEVLLTLSAVPRKGEDRLQNDEWENAQKGILYCEWEYDPIADDWD